MSIIEAIRAVSECGVLISLSGLFIYAAYRWIDSYFNDKAKPDKQKQVKAEHTEHDKLINLRTEVSNDIQDLITAARNAHDWDRVHVVEFSNSVMSVAYLPFRYMTCTYEVFRLGSTSTASRIDRLSTSLFTVFFNKLQEDHHVIVDLDKGYSECGAIRDLMVVNGERRALFANIVTSSGKSVGYVSIKNIAGFGDEDIEAADTLASQISALLGVADR